MVVESAVHLDHQPVAPIGTNFYNPLLSQVFDSGAHGFKAVGSSAALTPLLYWLRRVGAPVCGATSPTVTMRRR